MEKNGSAYFVELPRTMGDLLMPHLLERERRYAIVKTVRLAKIDYENFVTDMLADRQFLEDHAPLCGKGEVWCCILVQRRGSRGGVLVLPTGGCYVGWAAYIRG